MAGAALGEEDDGEPWDDWKPTEQTALDFIRAAEEAKQAALAAEAEGDEEEDSDDEWNPCAQGADGAAGGEAEGNEDEEEEDSDDDWAPAAQGAVDVKATEKEALAVFLRRDAPAEQGPPRYESKKESDAAGRMLQEMHRPPTVEEAKAEIPRGPDVEVDQLAQPGYRQLSQVEAISMVGKGASVNYQGQHGRTPLHKAMEHAYPVLAKAICDAGGDTELRDQYGETPLLLLAKCGAWNENLPKGRRSETIQMMLSCGADVHATNPRGRGVLHLACAENDHAAIETFIEGMADVNAKDLAGFTALMWAAGRNGADTVKMLLDYEADMNVKANRGQTAMTFALTNGCSAIVDILERHKMILDAEEQKRIKEKGEKKDDEPEFDLDEMLQLPKPAWACKTEKPEQAQPFQGKRVYMAARPDRHSNVYVQEQ